MGIPHQLRVRTKKSLSEVPVSGSPGATSGSDGQLEVALLFTAREATVSALEKTTAFLTGLNARINLVAVQTVPYTLALNHPPVSVSFNEQRLQDIVSESPIETTAHLYICRCPFETLTSVLMPGSILVVGTRKRWWPTWERKLARKLESAGFRILLLEVD
jgi:hypothetical protein